MILTVGDASVNVVNGEVRLDNNRGKWKVDGRAAVAIRWVRGEWEKGLARDENKAEEEEEKKEDKTEDKAEDKGGVVDDLVKAVVEAARKGGSGDS